MESLYENKTVLNKATCKAFMALTWPQNLGVLRWALWAVAVVALVYAGGLVWQNEMESIAYVLVLLALGLLAAFMAGWGWVLRLKSHTAAQLEAWQGETLEKTVVFGKQGIRQTSPLGTLDFAYSKLTKISMGRGILVLWMGRQVLLIAADGFTKGKPGDFLLFMKKQIKENKSRKS